MMQNKFFTFGKQKTVGALAQTYNLAKGPGFEPNRPITGIASIHNAANSDLTFFEPATPDDSLRNTRASACIIRPELANADDLPPQTAFLISDHPHLTFAKMQNDLLTEQYPFDDSEKNDADTASVAPGAVVHKHARLGPGVRVGPNAVISDGAVISDRTRIHAGTVIGPGVCIGQDSVIHPNCTVTHATIGARCVLQSGVQIGSRGYGYIMPEPMPPEGLYPVPHTGEVVLEDDVEIGAQSVIVRATLDETRIGRGTKIDGRCFIAHNVTVGPYSALFGGVSVAGSTEIGTGVVIMGCAAVAGHLKIGDRAKIGGMAAVTRSVAPGEFVTGIPALPLTETRRMFATLRQLTRREQSRRRGDK